MKNTVGVSVTSFQRTQRSRAAHEIHFPHQFGQWGHDRRVGCAQQVYLPQLRQQFSPSFAFSSSASGDESQPMRRAPRSDGSSAFVEAVHC
jgi:hypothetical protein